MRRVRAAAAAVGVCTLLAALVRAVSLRALPIFGDEALNLRMAVLAAKEPLARVWISLQESQPPLHVWLLALFLPLSPDPVRAGRILSVVAGILCVPAAAWTVRRTLEAFGPDTSDSVAETRIATGMTAALAALCPFFVFAQRLARVDGLFLLETILAAGLSVAVAVASARAALGREASRARRLSLGAAYGAVMGLTMLTRQAVSYPLWLLAPVAWLLLPPGRRGGAREWSRFLSALALAAAVAFALWLPMLLAPGTPDTMTRIFHYAEYRPAMTAGARLRMTLESTRLAVEAFWVYLTPPVLALACLAAAALIAAGRGRLLAYVLFWEALLLAPAAAFAANYFPRYALPAAVPVCLLAALGAARVWTVLTRRLRTAPERAAVGAVLLAGLLGPSLLDLARGERDWRNWRLLPIDRLQFVSGPPAGFASEAAADALRRIARQRPGPMAVLTPGISGNPTDAVWLLLGREPGIRLSYASDALARPLLPDPDSGGTLRLPGDTRAPSPREETVLAGVPVFAVVPDPLLTRSGWVDAVPFLARLNPGMSEAARFRNPAEPGTPVNAIVVLRLR